MQPEQPSSSSSLVNSFIYEIPRDTVEGAQRYVVRSLQQDDSIDELTELLHRAYAGLASQGLRFMATHQEAHVTAERLNGDLSTVVENVETHALVATVSLYEEDPTQQCQWYAQAGVWRFGQFGVEPALQAKGLGAVLMRRLEQQAKQRGALELACDTAEPAAHLRRWYEAMGYQFKQFQQWEEVNYRSVILSKLL